MAFNVDIYRNGIKLGSGSANNGSKTISSYSANLSRTLPQFATPRADVQVTATSGNNIGATWNTRVVTDGGATLTLADAAPFS